MAATHATDTRPAATMAVDACHGLPASCSERMLRRAAPSAATALLRRALSNSPRPRSSAAATAVASSSAVNSILLRSLKEHYLEVSKMTPPPKISPPKPYTIVKGALDQTSGPVLRRSYGEAGEEISISVARLSNIIPPGADSDSDGSDGAGGAGEQQVAAVPVAAAAKGGGEYQGRIFQ
ncbi:hypothetical protein TRIUR3_18828 [Triticum urartu]|uniref:Uncharacterized protein n=1 Tax=Triticum urartu TaxID=4572 RepID=M7ZKZ0_TRIUA|nr:hypothetical protein TRIUR3_18828 [Triticum urartu]